MLIMMQKKIENSQKTLQNLEIDYISTLKKFSKYEKDPNSELNLTNKIDSLDLQIAKEK
tara:strand:- start:384 stop:560 length:177 start_codon:yes stop_codon:yes gene_type:complete